MTSDEIFVEVQALRNPSGLVIAYMAVATYKTFVRRKTFPVFGMGTPNYDPAPQMRRAWSWCGSQKVAFMRMAEVVEAQIAEAAALRPAIAQPERWPRPTIVEEVHRVRRMFGSGHNRMRGGYVNVFGRMTDGDDA